MSLIITNQQNQVELPPHLEAKLDLVAETCLRVEGIDQSAEISMLLVDDCQIRDLNKTYRGQDKPTDVLSFPLWEKDEPYSAEILLGDIVISLETAQRQALEYEHSLSREVAYLMVHGLLHLLGYDHLDHQEKMIMRQQEEKILKALDLGREL